MCYLDLRGISFDWFIQVNVDHLAGVTRDNVSVVVSGSLFYKVVDSFEACFSVVRFEENVAKIGTSAVRSVISQFAVSGNLPMPSCKNG